jgi:hypothetical protein
MIVVFIGIGTVVLLIWTISFTMATESRAEQRRIEGIASGLYDQPSHHAA